MLTASQTENFIDFSLCQVFQTRFGTSVVSHQQDTYVTLCMLLYCVGGVSWKPAAGVGAEAVQVLPEGDSRYRDQAAQG